MSQKASCARWSEQDVDRAQKRELVSTLNQAWKGTGVMVVAHAELADRQTRRIAARVAEPSRFMPGDDRNFSAPAGAQGPRRPTAMAPLD